MAIFITMASFANPVQSKLSITVVGNQDVQIMVDNNRYQSQDNSIIINNLQPGSHSIKVYSARSKRTIWGNRNNTQLIYSSTVYVRPGYFVGITIDRNGKAKFNEREIRGAKRNDDWNDGRKNGRDDRYDNRNDRYDQRDDYNRGAVSEHSFSSIVQTLRREYSENSRLVLAKQIVDRNYFTTQQVKYILQLFPFEHHKLELAKYAYRNTTDQRNYFSVYDVFSYSRSKEELADYIRRYR
jgi:hypothetical protein